VSHRAGIDIRLISNPFPAKVLSEISRKPSIDACKYCNDQVSETIAGSPGNRFGFGAVNPLEKDYIREAEWLEHFPIIRGRIRQRRSSFGVRLG
jgi:hypothetical protein